MKKLLVFSFCSLLLAGAAFSQPKQKLPVKQAASELKKIMSGTGLPYKVINDSLAVIPYEGENIASFQVVVQKISDLYIVFSNLTEALPGKINDTKYKYLLQKNNDFDIIKTGIGDDNIVYVRADFYKAGATTALMTRIIKQVANVTNIIAGDLK
jgi:hypothetical protein